MEVPDSAPVFHLDDRVRVVNTEDMFAGLTGTVIEANTLVGHRIRVQLDGKAYTAYFRPHELQLLRRAS